MKRKRYIRPKKEEEEVTESMVMTARQRGKLAQANYLAQQPVEVIQMIAKQANTWVEARNIYLAAGLQPPSLEFAIANWTDKVKVHELETAFYDQWMFPHSESVDERYHIGWAQRIYQMKTLFDDVLLEYSLFIANRQGNRILEWRYEKLTNRAYIYKLVKMQQPGKLMSVFVGYIVNPSQLNPPHRNIHLYRGVGYWMVTYSHETYAIFQFLFLGQGRIEMREPIGVMEWQTIRDQNRVREIILNEPQILQSTINNGFLITRATRF